MTTITRPALSKEDVAALRKAERLCFDHGRLASGEVLHQIRAIRKVDGGAYDNQEVTYGVAVSSRVRNFTPGESLDQPFQAFCSLVSTRYEWQTIARQLRAGDEITLEWTRGNYSETTKAAGLVRDELRVEVRRGARLDVYLIDVSLTRDNSARMVRKAER